MISIIIMHGPIELNIFKLIWDWTYIIILIYYEPWSWIKEDFTYVLWNYLYMIHRSPKWMLAKEFSHLIMDSRCDKDNYHIDESPKF